MTALYVPAHALSAAASASDRTWPWRTALLLTVLFAMGNWSWSLTQRWNVSTAGQVDQMVDNIADGALLRQVAFLGLALYGLGALLSGAGRELKVKWAVAYPNILFVGWSFLSILWSIDPSMCGKRLIVFAAMVMTVTTLLRQFDIRQLAEIALICTGLTLVVSIGNELRLNVGSWPGYGIWRFGGMQHPNHAGLTSGVAMLASLYLFRFTRSRWLIALFCVAFAILFFTKSRTALMSTLVACSAFWLLSARLSRVAAVILLAAWLAAGVMWLSSVGDSVDPTRVLTMGRDDVKKADIKQLTGRTDIWKFALMQADTHPNRWPIGYGYETFWTPENVRGVSDFVKFKIPEGHNLYLDWYLELGAVGAGLFIVILLTAIWRWGSAAVRLRSPSAALAAAALCGTVVHGITESSLGDASLPTLMVYAAIAGAAILRPDEEVGI